MPGIRWETLVTDGDGIIDYERVKLLLVSGAFVLGVVGMIAALVLSLRGKDVGNDVLLIVSGALVVPLTGGTIAAGVSGRLRRTTVAMGITGDRRSAPRELAGESEEGAESSAGESSPPRT